ncbi:MAG: hypothetical protein WBM41_06585 [Arenicellales bacterium]
MKDNINIMIGTPAYNGMVHTDFVHSLLSYKNLGINFGLLSIGGESLITRARNSILARFYHSPEYTHLLFLDGDVFLDGADLKKMIGAGREVIGAPVPLKTTEEGKPVFNIHGNLGQEAGLLKVQALGTAVMMLSQRAVQALVDDAVKADNVYQANPYARGLGDTESIFDVFQVGVKKGVYLSEDYWVCDRLLELGFDIWVDLSIHTRHHGIRSY